MQIDPALASRLAAVLKKVAHGKPLAVAAAEAGVGAQEIERIVKELERELWARAREHSEAMAASDPRTRATRPEPPAARPAREKPAGREGLALVAYADGGSRGNPGKAACAAVVTDESGSELLRRARYLGRTTNNVAEYEGVILALALCRELGARHVTLRVDSELVVRQLEGSYRVKHAELSRLHAEVLLLRRSFDSVEVEQIAREDNEVADALVNAHLDGKDLEQA
jgi:ribonuclease HI